MCIIMSLNVNEMELKDPTPRTCGFLRGEEEEKKKREMSRLCSFAGTNI